MIFLEKQAKFTLEASTTIDVIIPLATVLISGFFLLVGTYITVTLPIKRGQEEISTRVGPPNGEGDLATSLSTMHEKVAAIDTALNNHITVDEETLKIVLENGEQTHQILTQLALQDVRAEAVKTILETKVKSS